MNADEIGPVLVEFAKAWREEHATVRNAIALTMMREAAKRADALRRDAESYSLAGVDRAADLDRALWRAQIMLCEFLRGLALQAGDEMDRDYPDIRKAWRRETP